MSIIKCHECGNSVSSEAKACPNCGVKPKMRPGALGIILVLFVGFVLFRCTMSVEEAGHRSAAKEAAKTPEQKAAEAAARAKEEQRIDTALRVEKLVKEHAKNPASLKFEQLAVSENSDIACGKYRATNSYNAVVPGIVVITPKGYSFEIDHWKKHCVKATDLYDMSSVVK